MICYGSFWHFQFAVAPRLFSRYETQMRIYRRVSGVDPKSRRCALDEQLKSFFFGLTSRLPWSSPLLAALPRKVIIRHSCGLAEPLANGIVL